VSFAVHMIVFMVVSFFFVDIIFNTSNYNYIKL
jgi:hypothetical protein